MSDKKRYYWLKLNENFFEEDTIQWLEEQSSGKDYIIFYLKLCLKSLSDDGYLVRYVGEKLIPYDVKALAKLTNTPADTVAVAMKTFIDIGLVKQLETGQIYMSQINEMVGSETAVAQRVRKHRLKAAESTKALQCNTDETKSNTEKEKELDKEIEIEETPLSIPKKLKNGKPISDTEETEESQTPRMDYQKVIDLFKEYCPRLPQIRELNDKRKKTLKAWGNMAEIEETFKIAGQSDFLCGINDRGWTATFDWIIKPDNRLKILEGGYPNRNKPQSAKEIITLNDMMKGMI